MFLSYQDDDREYILSTKNMRLEKSITKINNMAMKSSHFSKNKIKNTFFRIEFE